MADVLAQAAAYPPLALNPHQRSWAGHLVMGSGAIASQTFRGGVVFTRASAGTFTVVFPKCVRGWLHPGVVSATPTVFYAVVTAFDSAAGTATIRTCNAAGAATDPAAADLVNAVFIGESR